jgi:hypothetical protein|tara:strand:+ start:30618 stop:30758 length:141 start_codon:yes stop_codon:yes gene_type:complete
MKKCFHHPNKKRFSTKKEAELIILTSLKDLRIYYCDFCNGWHLTSK